MSAHHQAASSTRRRSPLSSLVALASLVLSGCPEAAGSVAPPQDAPPAPERSASLGGDAPRGQRGARRMARHLERIATEHVRINAYDNEGRASMMLAQLAAGVPNEERSKLAYLAARELLWAGRTAEAIEHLTGILKRREGGPRRRTEVASLLAMAHLRRGEEENCIARHGVDSCLLPIRGGGVHVAQEGSRAALRGFRVLLEADPEDLRSLWLANLAAMTLGEWPEALPPAQRIEPEAFASEHELPRFYDVAGPVGLAAEGHAGGCVVDDFDGDLDLDVLASSMGLEEVDQLRYFENRADGTFAERTVEAGLEGLVGGLNLCSGDLDNDGDLDALVLRGGWVPLEPGCQPNSLLRNEGDGSFTDVTEEAGMLSFHPTQTAAVADYDVDGWLDVFIGNESVPTFRHPSELYHNEGDGTFRDVAAEVGLGVDGFVKGAAWGDYDNDGLPDLYVSQCFREGANLLFHNEGPGPGTRRFREVGLEAGVRGPVAGFATWWFDYDNDGWQDIYVTRYDAGPEDVVADLVPSDGGREAGRPALYRNQGDGTFVDLGRELGLDRALMTMGCNYGDLDGDGWLDLYLGTGRPDFRSLFPNRMFRNDRGRRFQDVTTSGGFGHLQKGHGIAFADVDNDGDQDVFAVMGGAYTADTFRNALFLNPGLGTRWLGLELEGTRSNRDALGARIRVRIEEDGEPRDVHATVSTGGSFGAHGLRQTIGLGRAERILEVEVRWPAGAVERLSGLEPDRCYRLVEGDGRARALELPRIVLRHVEGSAEDVDCCPPGTPH